VLGHFRLELRQMAQPDPPRRAAAPLPAAPGTRRGLAPWQAPWQAACRAVAVQPPPAERRVAAVRRAAAAVWPRDGGGGARAR
jgi:hypothetical protein